MVMMISKEATSSLVPCGFLFSLNCLDNFPVDPATAPINATGHQLLTLCRPICAEERARNVDPLKGSKYFTNYFIAFVAFLSSLYFPVHRTRRCFSAFGTGCCTFWSTCCWHEWHQRRRTTGQLSPSSCAIKAHVQNEEGVGGRWRWSVFCYWSHGSGWQTEPCFFVACAAKMLRCWDSAHKKSWGAFKVSSIFFVISGWD